MEFRLLTFDTFYLPDLKFSISIENVGIGQLSKSGTSTIFPIHFVAEKL